MNNTELAVQQVITEFQKQNARLDKMLDSLSPEQWLRETAPGRNTGIYLLGHLAAVNDALLPLLGFGEKLHPELEHIFLTSPDKSGLEKPSLEKLKEYWKAINAELNKHISSVPAGEWFGPHKAVSAADFEKEPHRNKLNILINRSVHQGYHLGQLAYLK